MQSSARRSRVTGTRRWRVRRRCDRLTTMNAVFAKRIAGRSSSQATPAIGERSTWNPSRSASAVIIVQAGGGRRKRRKTGDFEKTPEKVETHSPATSPPPSFDENHLRWRTWTTRAEAAAQPRKQTHPLSPFSPLDAAILLLAT